MRQRSVSMFRMGALTAFLATGAACIPGVGDESSPTDPPVQPPVGRIGPPPAFEAARRAETPPPALSGGTLALLSDGRTAVAADPERDSLFFVDYRKQKVIATIPLTAGDEPGRVVEDADGRVHVALRRGGALVTLEATTASPRTWKATGRRALCAAPRGVAFDKARGLLHVACAEGQLVSLAPAAEGAVVRRLKLERDLRDVVVDGDTVMVSLFRSAHVISLDPAGKVIGRTAPPPRIGPNFGARGMAGTEGKPLPPTLTMEPAVAWRLVGVAPGETYMVHQRGQVEEVSTQSGGYGGVGCGGIVETAVTNVGVLGPSRPTPGMSFAVLPVDLAVSPDRSNVAVIAAGNARQSVEPFGQLVMVQAAQIINPPEGSDCGGGLDMPLPEMTPPIVPAPAGEPDDLLPSQPVVPRQPVGEAVAVAYDRTGHILVQTRQPATIQIVTAGRATIILAADDRTDTGHGVFHANSGSGLACASCHPEGGDDGRVWRFLGKDGKTVDVRRTQNLQGGILATAPFHWAGDLRDVGALMDEVFVNRMGGPKLEPAYLDVLKGWMDTMPGLPVSTAADATAIERGRTLFADASVGCTKCHDGGLLTNNRTVDVGTGGAFQVPSLRGIAWRAPFMHDGCAQTLKERFTAPCSGGDKHGVTSTLSPAQIDDLVSFMETL